MPGRLDPRSALFTVCAVLFLTFLDTTIVSVALGSIQSDLHSGVTSLQWVLNAYSLVFAALMLTAGALADRFGRKRLLVGGVAVFCLGSLLAALAPNSPVLILARAIMGIGAAACEPGTLSIVRQLYPDAGRRARAVGLWVAVAGLALALGPVIGGLLVGAGSWRAIFWFNLALGLLLLLAATRFVPESADPRPEPIDAPGFALGVIALAAGAFAVISGEQTGYRAPWIIVLFAVSALSFVGLILFERSTSSPMLDRRYLTRVLNGALFVSLAVYFGIFSIFFFIALYLEVALGYSGQRIAGVFAPMALAIALASIGGGRWVSRHNSRVPMTAGCVVAAGGLLLTAHVIGPHTGYLALALSLAVAGLGFGLAVVPATTAVLAVIPPQDSSLAASAINTSRQIGAVAGVAVLGSLVNGELTSDLHARLTATGLPPSLQSIVVNTLQHGGGDASVGLHATGLLGQVFQAAYAAFRSGLTLALTVSAVAIMVAAGVAWLTGRSPEVVQPVRSEGDEVA